MKTKFLCELILFSLLQVSCHSISPKSDSNRLPAAAENESAWPGLDCDTFFEILNTATPRPESVNDALQLAKTKDHDLFSRYVLIHSSMSLQESSFQFPRTLLYGQKMIMTFNGSPEQRGYERLELMCFDKEHPSFEFREITFPKEAKNKPDDLTDEEMKQPFVISKVGGIAERACTQCHSSPTRPNWDTYPSWPNNFDGHFYVFQSNFADYGMQPLTDGLTAFKKHQADQSTRYFNLDPKIDRLSFPLGVLLTQLNGMKVVEELKGKGNQLNIGPTKKKRFKEIFPNFVNAYPEKGLDYEDDPSDEFKNYYSDLSLDDDEMRQAPDMDADAVLRLSSMEMMLKPIGIQVSNWSMIPLGGYAIEDGYTSDFFGSISGPFVQYFFPHDAKLKGMADSLYALFSPQRSVTFQQIRDSEQKICDLLNKK